MVKKSRSWRIFVTVLALTSTLTSSFVPAIAANAELNGRTVSLLSNELGLSVDVIQRFMDQGYTLNDIREAVAVTKQSQVPVDVVIGNLHKSFATAKQLKDPEIHLDLPTEQKTNLQSIGTDTQTNDPSSKVPTVTSQMDKAPYMVSLSTSNVSPLTGGITISSTDMTLVGRNGMNFDLIRTYNSESAQEYDFNADGLRPSYLQTLYPLGVGWTWEISSIETDPHTNKKYLHLARRGTYGINDDLTLAGYQWQDLQLRKDTVETAVTVGGVKSAWTLTSLVDGTKQSFGDDGRTLQITDKYGNYVQFTYSVIDSSGTKAITQISNNINNKITIDYSLGSLIVLRQGSMVVAYKQGVVFSYGVQYILTGVEDSAGRETKYGYMLGKANYSMTSQNPTNYNPYALLTQVNHPTGAMTIFNYESTPQKRLTSSTSSNEAYRVASVQNRITFIDPKTGSQSTQDYNTTKFTYNGDMGSMYGSSTTTSTVLSTDLKSTTYEYNRQNATSVPERGYVVYNTKITQKDTTSTPTSINTINTYDYNLGRNVPISVEQQIVKNGTTVSRGIVKRTYDEYSNVTSNTDQMGTKTDYTYDATSHLLTKINQPISETHTKVTAITRDPKLKNDITLATILDQNPQTPNAPPTTLQQTRYDYDTMNNVIGVHTIDNGNDILTSYEYDSSGTFPIIKRVRNVIDADKKTTDIVTAYNFDKVTGNMSKYTDGNGKTTSYEYDALGRLTTQTNPDTSTVKLTYDDRNNNVEQVNEIGNKVRVTWNPLGMKVLTETFSNGRYQQKSKSTYDLFGRVVLISDADSNHKPTQQSFDNFNRILKVTHPITDTEAAVVNYSYDELANSMTTTDEDQNTFRETYDLLGRMTKRELLNSLTGAPNLIVNKYDFAGNLSSATDGKNQQTQYEYDALNHLKSVSDAQTPSVTTQYQYDMRGNVKQITYGDGTKVNKTYDELGRMIQQTDALNQVQLSYYDANGNLSKQTDRNGNAITFSYNTRNQLTKKTSTSGSISFEYDKSGQRTKMFDETGVTEYKYDDLGQLGTVTYPDGKALIYTYDANGNVISMQDPFGKTVTYGIDTQNRVQTVNSGGTSAQPDIQYNFTLGGLISSSTQGSGMTTSYGYNEFKLIMSEVQKKSDNTVVNTYGYQYDLNNNEISKTENSSKYNFEYDNLNRVNKSSQFNETYSYDKRGNRQTLQSDTLMLPTEGTFEYDAWNRLKKFSSDDKSKTVTYKYNGDGVMTERTENGVTIRYYNDHSNIIAEAKVVNGTPTLTARYIRGFHGQLVAREDATGAKAYYTFNGHGDVTGLWDNSGNVLNQYTYDIWGNILTSQEKVPNPFRYSGEFWDDTSKLLYLRARWYEPCSGRFINEDTFAGKLTDPMSLNLYSYVENNPLTLIDPSGHLPIPAWLGPLLLGTKIHNIISDFFVRTHLSEALEGRARTNQGVPQVPPYETSGRYDLGLWNRGYTVFEIAEIKPITYAPGREKYNEGIYQLERYIWSMNIAYGDNGAHKFVPMTSWKVNGTVLDFSDTQEILLTTYPQAPGMIYYELVDKKRPSAQVAEAPKPSIIPVPPEPSMNLPRIQIEFPEFPGVLVFP